MSSRPKGATGPVHRTRPDYRVPTGWPGVRRAVQRSGRGMQRRRRGGGGLVVSKRARPKSSSSPERRPFPGRRSWSVAAVGGQAGPRRPRYSGLDGDVVAAPAQARGLGADVPAACAGERGDAGRDRRDRRDGPADRLGPRLRALAGLHGGRSAPLERLPLVRRVRQPDRRGPRDPRHASPPGSRRCSRRRRSAGCAGSPGATFLGDASSRRRSARSPSTTTSTPGSSARTSCSRSASSALGVLVALEAWDVRGERRCRRRSALARGRRGARLLRARRHRHARDRGRAALRQRRRCRASARSSRRCGCTSARRPCSGSRSPCCSSGSARAEPRLSARRHRAARRAGGADGRRRDPVPDASCRWWLVLIHVTLAATRLGGDVCVTWPPSGGRSRMVDGGRRSFASSTSRS